MVTCPVALLLTNPLSSMDAMEPFEDPQRTERVMSSVVLSLNVPVAVNCLVAPIGMLELRGAIASETSVALVTVTVAEPEIPPEAAVTVEVPVLTAVASPADAILSTFEADEDH